MYGVHKYKKKYIYIKINIVFDLFKFVKISCLKEIKYGAGFVRRESLTNIEGIASRIFNFQEKVSEEADEAKPKKPQIEIKSAASVRVSRG